MATVLRIVDSADTLLFDFNAPTGTGNPGTCQTNLLSDFNLGVPSIDRVNFEASNRPGGKTVYHRHSFGVTSFRFHMKATSYDNLRTGILKLQELLTAGGILKIQPDGQTGALWADFEPGQDLPVLLDGRDLALYETLRLKETPKGIAVTILRQPGLRGASATFISALAFGVDPVTSVHGRTFTMTGNTKAPLNFTIAPVQAGSKVTEILMASRTRAGVGDLVSETGMVKCNASANNWTVTLSNNTAANDDSVNGGVGSGAMIDGTSANVGVMLKRFRGTRTTLLDSLRGWEEEFLRLRPTADSVWEVQLRWASSLIDPATTTNEAKRLTVSGGSTFGYTEVDLGHIIVPESGALGGVALELWARRISGTGNLHMNFIRNLPATPGKDVITRIAVPGGASESWLGTAEFMTSPPTNPAGLTAGTFSFTTGTALHLSLDAATEAGGITPNTGMAWPVGRHRVTFELRVKSVVGTLDYTVRVRNITDSTNAASQPVIDEPSTVGSNRLKTHVLEFDSVSGKSYQPQVVFDGGDSQDWVVVLNTSHQFIPALAQNEQAHTEPEVGIVHKRDSSGNHVGSLANEGQVPFYVEPGLTAIFIVPLDAPLPGYTEPESVKARTVTVTATGAPRFTG